MWAVEELIPLVEFGTWMRNFFYLTIGFCCLATAAVLK